MIKAIYDFLKFFFFDKSDIYFRQTPYANDHLIAQVYFVRIEKKFYFSIVNKDKTAVSTDMPITFFDAVSLWALM